MVKTFYGKEHFIVLYYVQRNKCIKEDDLRQLIKFDQRYLRTVNSLLFLPGNILFEQSHVSL